MNAGGKQWSPQKWLQKPHLGVFVFYWKCGSRGAACLRLAWKSAFHFWVTDTRFFQWRTHAGSDSLGTTSTPLPKRLLFWISLETILSTEKSSFNVFSCKSIPSLPLRIVTAFNANPHWSQLVLWFSFLFSNMHFQNNENKINQIKSNRRAEKVLLSDRTHLPRMHKAPGPKQPPKGRKDKSVEHMVVAHAVDQFWLNLSISVHQSVYPSATGDTGYHLE